VFIATAGHHDKAMLLRLCSHPYWNVKRMAARRLVDLLGLEDVGEVVDLASETTKPGDREKSTIRELLQALDVKLYALDAATMEQLRQSYYSNVSSHAPADRDASSEQRES
jgi:hypothetical protein